MKHEGPLPGEALPVGENSLTPEELSRVATFMFEHKENMRLLEEGAPNPDFTPKQRADIEAFRDGPSGLFETIKQLIVEDRE